MDPEWGLNLHREIDGEKIKANWVPFFNYWVYFKIPVAIAGPILSYHNYKLKMSSLSFFMLDRY